MGRGGKGKENSSSLGPAEQAVGDWLEQVKEADGPFSTPEENREAAKQMAAMQGIDWDSLSKEEQEDLEAKAAEQIEQFISALVGGMARQVDGNDTSVSNLEGASEEDLVREVGRQAGANLAESVEEDTQ